jgi:hypothetical protein
MIKEDFQEKLNDFLERSSRIAITRRKQIMNYFHLFEYLFNKF